MDYNVMSFRSVFSDYRETERDTEWSLAEVGINREWAIANMVMRAMRHVEWRGELFLRDILEGTAEPEQPYLINDEESGVYLWFCIVRVDREPPAFPTVS